MKYLWPLLLLLCWHPSYAQVTPLIPPGTVGNCVVGGASVAPNANCGIPLPTPNAKGDCSTDDTTPLQTWLTAGGGTLPIPPGGCFKVTATLTVPSNAIVVGMGPGALIKLVLTAGAAAEPVLDLNGSGATTTTGIFLSNFAVDGGEGVGLGAPTGRGGSVAYGAAVLVESNYTTLINITCANSYDNCIAIGQLTNAGGSNTAAPNYVTVTDSRCTTAGLGTNRGGCIDNLAGAPTLVSDSEDTGSAYGFICDYGSGAICNFNNLSAKANTVGGYYIGSGNFNGNNLESNFPSTICLWIDRYAASIGSSNLSNVKCQNAGQQGLQIAAGGWNISNVAVKNASTSSSGTYDAIYVYNPVSQTANITNLRFTNISTSGSTHRYGYNESAGGTYTISASIDDTSNLNGQTAAIASGTATAIASVPSPLAYSNSAPESYFQQLGAGTNLGWWGCGVLSGVFSCQTMTDAQGTGCNVISATRGTTTAVTNIALGCSGSTATYSFPSNGQATFTNQIQAPYFAATGSTLHGNPGIYEPATNQLGFSTNNLAAGDVDANQHFRMGGASSPTISSGACGTGTNGVLTSGNDQAGLITIGSATTATCAVTFALAYTTVPRGIHLQAANAGAATALSGEYVSALSTTGFTITGTLASTTWYYWVQ